jgi:transposase
MCAYRIHLDSDELARLEQFVKTGNHGAREIMRAWILIKSHEGKSAQEIHDELQVTPKTISKVRRRYASEGLDAALVEKPRLGPHKKVTPEIEAHVTALACEAPPTGHKHVTIARIKEQLAGRFNITLSFGTVQSILKHHNLKPWKKSPGAFPASTPLLSVA